MEIVFLLSFLPPTLGVAAWLVLAGEVTGIVIQPILWQKVRIFRTIALAQEKALRDDVTCHQKGVSWMVLDLVLQLNFLEKKLFKESPTCIRWKPQ